MQASVSASSTPQAAIVGVIVSDRFEVFFDTLGTSRKADNLRHNPAVALVDPPPQPPARRGTLVQLEGVTDESEGADLARLLDLHFARFPEGRERQSWPGITYLRVTPTWLRYSDFSVHPPEIVEFQARDLT